MVTSSCCYVVLCVARNFLSLSQRHNVTFVYDPELVARLVSGSAQTVCIHVPLTDSVHPSRLWFHILVCFTLLGLGRFSHFFKCGTSKHLAAPALRHKWGLPRAA